MFKAIRRWWSKNRHPKIILTMPNDKIVRVDMEWPYMDFKKNPELKASMALMLARNIFALEFGAFTPMIINALCVKADSMGESEFAVTVMAAMDGLRLHMNPKDKVSRGPAVKAVDVFDLRRLGMTVKNESE